MSTVRKTPGHLAPSYLFGALKILVVDMTAEVEKPELLPRFLGSALRGVLGWQVRRLVCLFPRAGSCGKCAVRDGCPYFNLVERKSELPGLSDSPKGYVISPGPTGPEGVFTCRFTLVGDCMRFLPILVKAMAEGQAAGLGHSRNPYRIHALEKKSPNGMSRSLALNADEAFYGADANNLKDFLGKDTDGDTLLRIKIRTPLRLRRKGVYQGRLHWPFVLGSLVRRLEALNCLYNGGEPIGKAIWNDLQSIFGEIEVAESTMAWRELSRYSNRQRKKVPMGGIVGQATLQNISPEIMEWFRAAGLVHVGKGATMGLGQIEVVDRDSRV